MQISAQLSSISPEMCASVKARTGRGGLGFGKFLHHQSLKYFPSVYLQHIKLHVSLDFEI